jgi:IS30 family transposase
MSKSSISSQEKKGVKKYHQLRAEEREEIRAGLEHGCSRAQIAKDIGVSESTISRELRRNGAPVNHCRYNANQAQKRYDERKAASHERERLADPVVRAYVERHLGKEFYWTPEMTAKRLTQEIPGHTTNYESIYQWVYEDRPDLIGCLPRGHKQRHKRGLRLKSRAAGKIQGRVDIDKRPAEIDTRQEAGHWEADTVVSRQSQDCVAVFTERKSRKYITVKMRDKSAESMLKAAIIAFSSLPKSLLKTITFDNGTENALHEKICELFGMKSYFCKPYHSWEKGGIENRNGILRRFFPKKTNWALTKKRDLNNITNKINAMPMTCLGYKTPNEVFARCLALAS